MNRPLKLIVFSALFLHLLGIFLNSKISNNIYTVRGNLAFAQEEEQIEEEQKEEAQPEEAQPEEAQPEEAQPEEPKKEAEDDQSTEDKKGDPPKEG